MKTEITELRSISLVGTMVLVLSAVVILALAGCEQPLKPGETEHKLKVAWPIFDVEKSAGVDANGVHWEKEKGDAAFWLASWEKLQKFDKHDGLTYRKERSTILPFYNAELEDTPTFIKKWGSVLLYPYKSYEAKSIAGAVQPATAPQK